MISQLDYENADVNIAAAEITVLTHTPDAANPRLCQALVLLGDGAKDLDGTGGNFTIRVTIGGGYGAARTLVLPAAQSLGFLLSEVFPVPAALQVLVRVLSPNVADTDVDVRAYLFDAGISEASTIQLANDAITADKFDETTAFPVGSADSGATKIARTGADSDTLETVSDQLDTVTSQTRGH